MSKKRLPRSILQQKAEKQTCLGPKKSNMIDFNASKLGIDFIQQIDDALQNM